MPSDMLLFVIVSSAICLGCMIVLWRMAPSVTTPAPDSAPAPDTDDAATESTAPESPLTIAMGLLLVTGICVAAGVDPVIAVGAVLFSNLRRRPDKVIIGLSAMSVALLASYFYLWKEPVPLLWFGSICWAIGLLLYTAQFPRWKTLHRGILPLLLTGMLVAWFVFVALVPAAMLAALALVPPAVHVLIHRKY